MAEESIVKKENKGGIRRFLMKSTNGMALGLFGTLIIGTIIALFGMIPGLEVVASFANLIKGLMGVGIGLGVALALEVKGVAIVAIAAAGAAGTLGFGFGLSGWKLASYSDPLSCYCSALCAYFAIKYILRKKTPVDLILIPLIGLGAALGYVLLLSYWVHYVTIGLQMAVELSFQAVPWLMVIIVSVLVGMALTAPISSVAVCVAINIGATPLAAMSALIGCCVQMVGFAVQSARDNKWGSVLAIGIGTSMLQFKNIIRKPVIWLPTIIASALLSPFAFLFRNIPNYAEMEESAAKALQQSLSVGAGMGTSGLVGPINTLASTGWDWVNAILIVGVCVVLAGASVFAIDLLFRKAGWIKKGDFALAEEEPKEEAPKEEAAA